jgi:hypothetical protein
MSNIKLQMQEFWVRNNIAFLVRYWWTAKDALKRVKEAPESFDEFKGKDLGSGYVDAVLSGHLEHHNYAGVLLAFATFEEFFTVLCTDLGALRNVSVSLSDLKDRGVPRFRKFIHKACQLKDDELQVDWAFLEQFATVRNCIVHANGNKGRLADPRSLDKLVAAYPEELSCAHGVKLVISDAFVTRCLRGTGQASLALIRLMDAQSNEPLQATSGGSTEVE